MKTYSLSHVSDHALLRDLAALVARDRATTAEMLAQIAEVDARKLYLPAAYPSMFAYCVGELRLSEEAAFKRIHAARVARRFPAIFHAVADGRLHLSAVILLAPHLTEDTADELMLAATHRTKSEIEQLLAERFPRPDMLAWVAASKAASPVLVTEPHAPGRVEGHPAPESGPEQHAPGRVGDCSRVQPLSSQSYGVQFTLSQHGHDQLRYAQTLLGHQVPSGDIAEVVERALDSLVERLEKRRFAATSRPRPGHGRPTRSPRHVPADVKRAVWERDGGRCTFASEAGRRCEARTRLEFDHVQEVARGGEATMSGIQLRCRAHNQFGAECTFGPEFMRHKRIAAAEAREAATARTSEARAFAAARSHAETPGVTADRDVVPWLRQLGFSATEARRGAERCAGIPEASLEQRVRVAMSCIGVRGTRFGPTGERLEAPAAGYSLLPTTPAMVRICPTSSSNASGRSDWAPSESA